MEERGKDKHDLFDRMAELLTSKEAKTDQVLLRGRFKSSAIETAAQVSVIREELNGLSLTQLKSLWAYTTSKIAGFAENGLVNAAVGLLTAFLVIWLTQVVADFSRGGSYALAALAISCAFVWSFKTLPDQAQALRVRRINMELLKSLIEEAIVDNQTASAPGHPPAHTDTKSPN